MKYSNQRFSYFYLQCWIINRFGILIYQRYFIWNIGKIIVAWKIFDIQYYRVIYICIISNKKWFSKEIFQCIHELRGIELTITTPHIHHNTHNRFSLRQWLHPLLKNWRFATSLKTFYEGKKSLFNTPSFRSQTMMRYLLYVLHLTYSILSSSFGPYKL